MSTSLQSYQDAPLTRRDLDRAMTDLRAFVLAALAPGRITGRAGGGGRTKDALEQVEAVTASFVKKHQEHYMSAEWDEAWREGGQKADEGGLDESSDASSSSGFDSDAPTSWSSSTSVSDLATSYPPPIATSPTSPSPSAHPPLSHPSTTLISHVNHPVGSRVAPGTSFIKTWRLRNTSSHALHPHSALRFSSGAVLQSCLPLMHVGPIEAGDEFDVSVVMKAPLEPDQYKAVWWMDDCEEASGQGGAGRLEVEVWIIVEPPTTSLSATLFPSTHFPETMSEWASDPNIDETGSAADIAQSDSSLSVPREHSVILFSPVELSQSVDWSERRGGPDWDGCGCDVDEAEEDLSSEAGDA